ncbi:MAG: ribosomal-protein-alanine N-acetyltransferase [Actinobacteria bacterium HGW-Actinobacteria-4]|nr:MAG: ribosomal-protein-alanine N-acetyltransferase [Actinobacteria bacterium HGW-Actinobacteria-4]
MRDLTWDDLPWVAEQEQVIFGPAAWSSAVIRDDFAHGMKRYRGIEVDGQLVGYAVYGYDGDAFSLMNIAVVEDARGAGHGRAFMEDFLGQARAERASEVWLEVAVTNAPAIALYRSYGFEDVRVRKNYYQPGNVDAVVMRVRLD